MVSLFGRGGEHLHYVDNQCLKDRTKYIVLEAPLLVPKTSELLKRGRENKQWNGNVQGYTINVRVV